MSFNNMDNVTIGGKYDDDGTKIFFNLCFKIIFINKIKQIRKCRRGMSVTPPPQFCQQYYICICEKLGHLENK